MIKNDEAGSGNVRENGFSRIMRGALEPMLAALGFVRQPELISGRLYLADFISERCKVSIAFEPGDDALFVYIFGKVGNGWTDIDDRSQTPRLEDLNRAYREQISAAERVAARERLAHVECHSPIEKRLVKVAADLAVTLPRYLQDRD